MAQFKTIHTALGLAAIARAEAGGTAINLTQMAVGDGNGNAVTPTETMTGLVRERYRAAINRVYQMPGQPNRFSAELVVPVGAGGFVMREVGVFDADGSLFAVGNLPETYKPLLSEGAFADTVVRLDFEVVNADVITLQIDPNVAVATQQWISNNVTAAQLIPGGTTGQFLSKQSNADGDYEWSDVAGVNVVVNTVEETQTLAADQTIIDWEIVNNTGLAIYVEGERLRADQWTPHPTINTRATLAAPFAAGTKVVGVQNEPAGTLPDPLVKGQNLADVPNKTLARQNLDIFSRDETRAMAPHGMIAYFGRTTAPVGWLKCNGAAVSRTAYADLFAAISTFFGAGDGFSTFNLPDLRGEFVRGHDDGRGVDVGRVIGSAQAQEIQSHGHGASSGATGSHTHTANSGTAGAHGHTAKSDGAGAHNHSASTGEAGDHSHEMTFPRDRGAVSNGNAVYGDEAFHGTSTVSTSSSGAHTHSVSVEGVGNHIHAISIDNVAGHQHTVTIDGAGQHAHDITVNAAGGIETRPRNVALLACIKY